MLELALNKGIVLSGLSAGSICWFSKGSSDSRRLTSDSTRLINVTGLGFIDAILCPHFDAEPHRRPDIKKKMMGSSKVAICLDNGVALEVVGNEYRIIKSKSTAKAYKAYWKGSKYYLDEIKNSNSLMSIDSLLEKQPL
jgi:dipeptidase E